MALVNVAKREINCKIVYYGPGFCGKTTNLQYIHALAPSHARGDLRSVATEREKTLFFEFLPLELGTVHGFQVKFHLYTVPGQIVYEQTRMAVLTGADGVVFVADSGPDKLDENFQSLVELESHLLRLGKDPSQVPVIMQWNKRDLPDAIPLVTLERYLNRRGLSSFQATALTGAGVFPTLLAICQTVIVRL